MPLHLLSRLTKQSILLARTCAEFAQYLLQQLWSRIRTHLLPTKRAPRRLLASAPAQPKRAVGAQVAPGPLSPEQQMLWSNDPRIWRRWR